MNPQSPIDPAEIPMKPPGSGISTPDGEVTAHDVEQVGDEPARLLIISHRAHRSETSQPEPS